ncbi:IDEAL domain-containing protein [Clostridium sp. PL3]|uniref:IDEAL domain-containing protein n=1 Tax=Clostridium thailandense TaxID=2794346 RepID=A0A949U181_9CLOT|nr:IDEAL domain-containing protein [Clostridium thailandense]MBV7276503.1 IDEAL domain-containing protein [Clostridium thailandense]
MKINNFILSGSSESEDFEYGMEILPKKIPNKLTDRINVSIEKKIIGKNRYNLSFKRKVKFEIINNNYNLSKEIFGKYINFLVSFIYGLSKSKEEFNIENQGRIMISFLNEEFIKIVAIVNNNDNSNKVFFTLSKQELLIYIEILKNIYFERYVDIYSNYQMNYLVNPITKEERKNIYVGALYAFIDSALDNRDEDMFYQLSKEINTILNN